MRKLGLVALAFAVFALGSMVSYTHQGALIKGASIASNGVQNTVVVDQNVISFGQQAQANTIGCVELREAPSCFSMQCNDGFKQCYGACAGIAWCTGNG
jgi:hypothetical protein